jgi:hypothetical protein
MMVMANRAVVHDPVPNDTAMMHDTVPLDRDRPMNVRRASRRVHRRVMVGRHAVALLGKSRRGDEGECGERCGEKLHDVPPV